MEDDRYRFPQLGQQPPAVDFIDHRMKNYHPMFTNNNTHYDSTVQQFVPNKPPQIVVQPSNDDLQLSHKPHDRPLEDTRIDPWPVYTDQKAMAFWNSIFTVSMTEFKLQPTEFKRSVKYGFDIRDKPDWESVYSTLETAKDKYCEEKGAKGIFRKGWRRLVDNASPFAQATRIASKLAPDNMYSTPVLGAVSVIMDAMKVAGKRRAQALGFADADNLEARFSDIQLFVGMFPEDENIRKVSSDLTISILNAVEQTIAFFIASIFPKMASSIFNGESYGDMLEQKIQEIDSGSTILHREAVKSHMHQSQLNDQMMQKKQDQMLHKQTNLSDGMNSLLDLFNQHDENMKSMIVTMFAGIYNRLDHTPPQEFQALEFSMSQEDLHHMINTHNIDIQDATSISNMKGQFLSRELARAEQVIQTEMFRQWLVLPASARLLIHWEPRPSRIIGDISPLSVMCSMMTGLLRSQPRFLPLIFFGGKHISRVQEDPFNHRNLLVRSLIDQLLRHHDFDMRPFADIVELDSLENLLRVFESLIYQLPNARTICCIIDGIVLLEREEYSREALPVLAKLVDMADRRNTPAPIKLLFTSTPASRIVRGIFEEENLIMNVTTLRSTGMTPSGERMARELGCDDG